MKLTTFGERVALEIVSETYSGTIALPEKRSASFFIGRCIAVGDGKLIDGSQKEVYIKDGSVYMFQLDFSQRTNATFMVDKKPVLMLHQGDMIAELTSQEIKFDTVTMVGNWMLLKPYVEHSSNIVLPENAGIESFEINHFRLAKPVPFDPSLKVGDEIFGGRGRMTTMDLDGQRYVFIHRSFVYGVLPAE